MAIPLGPGRTDNALLRAIDMFLLGAPHKLAILAHAFSHARRLDALIFPGTGILDDFGERPSGMPATLFGWCLAAKLCGTRIAFVSVGAGPIEHPLSRWLMKTAAGMADYRSYRDTVSKRYMESIGVDTRRDGVYPDLAFRLPSPSAPPRAAPAGRLTVAVGVMSYFGWHNDGDPGRAIYMMYIKKIRQFVLWLLDQGHDVRILMGDETDWQAVADVVTTVASARPDLAEERLLTAPMGSLHDLMRQIAETDLVVATRFHNIVCALKLGKPTVSIGYAAKNDALMEEMGLCDFCQHVETLDLNMLVEQFTELKCNRQDYIDHINEVNLMYQNKLEHQQKILVSRILPSVSTSSLELQGTGSTKEHDQ